MATESITPELLGIRDAQQFLGGVSRPKIYGLINDGEITRVKLGRRALITTKSLQGYVQRLEEANDK